MGAMFSQFYPPSPPLTEKNLPSQRGKVFLITGGYSGVGYQLVEILYKAGGKVYIAGRSEEKAMRAIEEIKSRTPIDDEKWSGELEFLLLRLDDLASIKSSVAEFQRRESHLHVLWNNAGRCLYPEGEKTVQGHEVILGTNCLGPHLFTCLILPSLQAAAKISPPGTVRIIWSSSILVDASAPKNGFVMSEITSPSKDQTYNYTISKTGNWFLASQFGHRVSHDGIVSMTQNPGNLRTNITRETPKWVLMILYPLLWDAHYGAYTELYAGLSPEITVEDNGGYIVPWGRKHPNMRKDLLDALESELNGGAGLAEKFWEWCERETTQFK
jgi:NAD(P)-dependent dehydrogenase (short-subunit alcohol dehydrogenase family)